MQVLIADPVEASRAALAAALRAEGVLRPVEARDSDEARAAGAAGGLALALVDISLPGLPVSRFPEGPLAVSGGVRTALLGAGLDRMMVAAAMLKGAAGILPRGLEPAQAARALGFMAQGARYVAPELLLGLAPAAREVVDLLSGRELQVLGGLARGKTNKSIAWDLSLSEATVKLHVKTLCRKLGAANRTQAALTARDAGLG